MKGKGKRLAALLTLLVLTFSSVLIVDASNTKLIKRTAPASDSTETYAHKQVSVAVDTEDTADFDLTVKRPDDSFTLYNLVTITPSNAEGSTITSINVAWAKPVADFIAANSAFAEDPDYASPVALGDASVDSSVPAAQRAAAEAAAKTAKERKLIALINAMKSEYAEASTKSSTALGKLDKVAYVDGEAAAAATASSSEVDLNSISDVVVKATGAVGSSEWNMTYSITGVPFGLYFVDATNPARASGGGYQPVVVDLIPEQTGPSGNWYMDTDKTASLKNESINLVKTINGGKSDIVREGEIVSFVVEFDIPLYPKTGDTFDYTEFCAFDDMSQGYTLIATSASLTYFDVKGREYHPAASLTGDNVGNKIASDTNGTYEALLMGYSYKVYYADDPEQKAWFYITESNGGNLTVYTNNGGQLSHFPLSKQKTNGTYVFSVSDLNNVNNYLDEENQIPSSYLTTANAAKFKVASTPKSLISVNFDYQKLMSETTYVERNNTTEGKRIQHPDFTLPSKVRVIYDAIVNDTAYLGNDDNTNTVTVYYITDTTGQRGEVTDKVVGWTYGANIVKVDGVAYEEYLKLSEEEKQAKLNAGDSPFLEGAVFDIYRLDTIYCGGENHANQNETPAEQAYSDFVFYDDPTYPVTSIDSNSSATRYEESRTGYLALVQKAFTFELTLKKGETNPAAIAPAVTAGIASVGQYNTADLFTNKYNYSTAYTNEVLGDIHERLDGNALLDYVIPKASTKEGTVKWDKASDFASGFVVYVPKWVQAGECAIHSGAHWHLEAYSLFWADTTSISDENGVLLTGFDPNQYLMIEKQAPAGGYNKLNTAIYFEVNQYTQEEYTANNSSYAGFTSDVYDHDDGESKADNNEDGIYHFTIKNYTGLTLPSTGGIGTLLFTLIGVIIMAGAIIFILARRKKLRGAAAMMAVMLMLASVFMAPLTANAATTISLDNGDGITSGVQKAVFGGTATFTVHLRDKDDELTSYQIGEVVYNDETDTWSDLKWVENLYSSLGDYSLDTGNEDIPTTPLMFTQLPAKEQADFLNWVYDTKDKSGVGSANKTPSNKFAKTTNSQTGETYMTISGVQYGMYLIKGTNPTLNRDYSILTLSAAPELQGPMGVYYLTGDLEATLKYADVTVDKKINGAEYDVVRTGETVKFEIAGEVPNYYPIVNGIVLTKENGEEYTEYDWNANYKFSLTDDMSSAFKFDPTKEVTLHFNAGDKDDPNATWTPVPENVYTMLIASPYDSSTGKGVVWFKDSTDKNGNNIVKYIEQSGSSYNVTWYVYNDQEGSIAKLGTSTLSAANQVNNAPDASIISAYQTATGATTVGTFSRITSKDVFAISFDYSKLIEKDANGVWQPKYKWVGLTYYATVTENCKPGTDDNTNTINLWYRSDIAGHYTPITDTVRAYTYALRLVKTDGEADPVKYLLGAQFKLYKEAFEYVPSTPVLPDNQNPEARYGEAPDSSTWEYYSFAGYAANGEYTPLDTDGNVVQNPTAPTAQVNGEETTLTTLDLVESADFGDGRNAYFRYVQAPAGEDGLDFDHYHVKVYVQMDLKDQTSKDSTGADYPSVVEDVIYSVDTADGVLIEGLEDASYVLIETQQPSGYNALTEAMRFEINRISAEQHLLTQNAAYDSDIIFYSANEVDPVQNPDIVDAVAVAETSVDPEDETKTITTIKYYQGYSDGIYAINVKNYQGLTLPSTGGMGTLLFTIIGIVVMAVVIVVIVAKRKKNAYM